VRQAIGDCGRHQRLIRTYPRKGLRFVGATQEQADIVRVVLPKDNKLVPERPSIAILQFANMSGDREQDYFAAGVSEDISIAISKAHWHFVVTRNLARDLNGEDNHALQARKRGIRYVLEGSVRKSGRRVRVTVQLMDAMSDHQVWAERYDRELVDIFAVQDDITEKVVAAVEPRIYANEGVRANRKPPESLDAWECVLRALYLINSRAKPDIASARTLLEKAVAINLGYAQAHSLLSFTTTLSVHLGWEPREPALHAASETARQALRLDQDEPWAHLAMGYALSWSRRTTSWSRRTTDAIRAYEKALSLNPNFAIAHWLFALALCYLGRGEEALEHADTAERLSPRDLLALGNTGVFNNVRAAACFVAGRYREGIEYARLAINESPKLTPAYRALILNCAFAGEIEEARVALRTLRTLAPAVSPSWVREANPFERAPERQRWVEAFRLAGLE
jgi:TolB-like protein/Flp pilus assembly protein TadD